MGSWQADHDAFYVGAPRRPASTASTIGIAAIRITLPRPSIPLVSQGRSPDGPRRHFGRAEASEFAQLVSGVRCRALCRFQAQA